MEPKVSIKELIANTPATELFKNNPVHTVWSDATAREALEIMLANKIHSLPIADVNTKDYVGMLDLFDLVKFISDNFDHSSLNWGVKQHDDRQKTGLKAFVKLDKDEVRNHFVSRTAKIAEVIDRLGAFPKGEHRALIAEHVNVPCGYITPTNVIGWLSQNINYYGHLFASSTLKQQNLINQFPEAVKDSDTAIAAFRAISKSGLNGLPIVNEDGVLVANVSISDILGITDTTFERLGKNIIDYLADHTNTRTPPLVCRENDQVETVILRLAVLGIHQMWVVDANKKPIGYVSLSDIVQLVKRT